MSIPSDDDGLGTIGLPRGAMKEMLGGAGAPRPKPPTRPATDPRAPDPRGVAARPDGGPSGRDLPREIEPAILATAPPPGVRRPRPEPPTPVAKPSQDQRPRPPIASAAARPRRDTPAPEQAPSLPRRPSPPAADERSLDDSAFLTNPPPAAHDRPAARPQPRPPVGRADEVARPLPDDTCAAPPGAVAAPVFHEAVESLADTPVRFPGSEGRARPPAPVPGRRAEPSDEIDRTQGFFPGILAASSTKSILQFFNNSIGEWCFLGEVDRGGKVLGRSTFQGTDAGRECLAEEHLRIGIEGNELYVEPLESLNGVYRRLPPNRREELSPHTRFRIGRHVLEVRLAPPIAAATPLRAEDGEVFQSRVLTPLGFVDLIGPDGRPYLSFPLTKRDERGTRIGRAGAECDIALTGDEWVSQRHARLGFNDGKGWIEDLESTNGTFLIVDDRIPLRRGTARSPATGDEILVGVYKIRVIEWKA